MKVTTFLFYLSITFSLKLAPRIMPISVRNSFHSSCLCGPYNSCIQEHVSTSCACAETASREKNWLLRPVSFHLTPGILKYPHSKEIILFTDVLIKKGNSQLILRSCRCWAKFPSPLYRWFIEYKFATFHIVT